MSDAPPNAERDRAAAIVRKLRKAIETGEIGDDLVAPIQTILILKELEHAILDD